MKRKIIIRLLLCIILSSCILYHPIPAQEPEPEPDTTYTVRPSVHGQLKVQGYTLADSEGNPVQLHGISTHGISWYPEFINDSLFEQLSTEWKSNLIRLPMYSLEYIKDKKLNLSILQKGIEAGISSDMYVIVDWHILEDSNPLDHVEEARDFFDNIASTYAGVPNIIYEICNEPNGDTTWDDIYDYAQIIIPVIRKYSPEAIIIVGTPDYDRDLTGPVVKRIDDPGVMYALHFYAASHNEILMDMLRMGIETNLPVFISECGITESDGGGEIDYEYAIKWFTYLNENDIGYTVWNLSNKNETSSFVKASSGEHFHLDGDDLTYTGKWVRELLQGTDPALIERGGTRQDYTIFEWIAIQFYALGDDGYRAVKSWPWLALICAAILAAALGLRYRRENKQDQIMTYDDLVRAADNDPAPPGSEKKGKGKQFLICLFLFLSMIYLVWRIAFSIYVNAGVIPIICNILLLAVEVMGFLESVIHYGNMLEQRERPLPEIDEDEYPDVDIFIATYNEPEEMIRKTVNGCKHLKYPDRSKVHIWVCDDNRRAGMKELARQMEVGYFDRPDNEGAKAGNLNHAMSFTSAPYVVTLDADMIVKSDFLLKTIPYFVHTEKCCSVLPEEKRRHLGFLQTPQCFYDPDVFQYGLYSENNVPNEQDFFYRAIEVGKTSSNSVIYGGSNTVLSRQALNDIGGFYTGTITEDFATGILIEAAGYLSLGISEPLASGRAPNTFDEHLKQRTRWGRGVINTAKKLHLVRRSGLNVFQKLSYLSSVAYWYSPIKNLIYLLSPLMFAVLMVPVFRCTWMELLIFWIPMFLAQDICLRVIGKNKTSIKWSGINETCVMPFLLIPVIKETLGMSLSKFVVTDKTGNKKTDRKTRIRYMLPFLILIAASVYGCVRVIVIADMNNFFGMLIIVFWMIRNMYFMIMSIFLINGRDSDEDTAEVKVKTGEMIQISKDGEELTSDGISTLLTEHSMQVFLDEDSIFRTGDIISIQVDTIDYSAKLKGIITGIRFLRFSGQCLARIEILDYNQQHDAYLQILYDRVPTLPQSLNRDFRTMSLLWRNIVYRLMRTL